MTSTEPETTTIEALDFTTACDAKGESQVKPTPGACEKTAEFSAHVHACQPNHHPVLLFCQEHIDAGIRLFQAKINLAKIVGIQGRCSDCGFEINAVEDVIWDVQPIKQHHQQ